MGQFILIKVKKQYIIRITNNLDLGIWTIESIDSLNSRRNFIKIRNRRWLWKSTSNEVLNSWPPSTPNSSSLHVDASTNRDVHRLTSGWIIQHATEKDVTQEKPCETWVAVGTEILISLRNMWTCEMDGGWAREIASNTKHGALWENNQECLTYKKYFSNISKSEPFRNQMPGVDAPVGMPLCQPMCTYGDQFEEQETMVLWWENQFPTYFLYEYELKCDNLKHCGFTISIIYKYDIIWFSSCLTRKKSCVFLGGKNKNRCTWLYIYLAYKTSLVPIICMYMHYFEVFATSVRLEGTLCHLWHQLDQFKEEQLEVC